VLVLCDAVMTVCLYKFCCEKIMLCIQVLVIAAGAEAQQQVQVGCRFVITLTMSLVLQVAGHMMLTVLIEDIWQDFKFGAAYKACVISYETLRKHAKDLKGTCDILICDEGHRYVEHILTSFPGQASAWLGNLSHALCCMQTEGGGGQQNDRQPGGTGLPTAYPAHRCRSSSYQGRMPVDSSCSSSHSAHRDTSSLLQARQSRTT
jgi:hypothetical protein